MVELESNPGTRVPQSVSQSNVREICGNHLDNSDIVKFCLSYLSLNFSISWAATAIFIFRVCSAICQLSNPLPHFALTHYT